jgi:uncharacterized protein (DUF305 family)
MTRSIPRATIALLALAVASGPGAARAQQPAAMRQAVLSPAEFEALYRARADSARMRFTPADVGFIDGMIGHHAQALVMAALAPTRGASPSVQTLAARITNAQQDEITRMQRWLSDRGQPVPLVRIDGLDLVVETVAPAGAPGRDGHAAGEHGRVAAEHAGHATDPTHDGHGEHALMPGMLTRDQLEALGAARGTEFDRLFLRGMIHHHGGAVTMVRDLFATDGAAQDPSVFKLASDIQADQVTEIARMQRMLDEMEEAR